MKCVPVAKGIFGQKLPHGRFVRFDVTGPQKVGLLLTQVCRGELAHCRGPRQGEERLAPLAQA